jgi:hypothetical protein
VIEVISKNLDFAELIWSEMKERWRMGAGRYYMLLRDYVSNAMTSAIGSSGG